MAKILASEVAPQRLMEEWLTGRESRATLGPDGQVIRNKGFESVRWIDVPAFHPTEVFHKEK
ncbi:MAG: hypothetical protein P4L10_02530 [Acidobacteriaceae bacterium]|jgi:hypothetical protein|nr:hypothetical protein [Acidobacteriaceae bacterium]